MPPSWVQVADQPTTDVRASCAGRRDRDARLLRSVALAAAETVVLGLSRRSSGRSSRHCGAARTHATRDAWAYARRSGSLKLTGDERWLRENVWLSVRWIAGVSAGCVYMLVGIFEVTLASVFMAFLATSINTLTGQALLRHNRWQPCPIRFAISCSRMR